MNTITYNKLVRDKIPEMIAQDGRKTKTRQLTDLEYLSELKKKLTEEAEEFLESNDPEELADILEVIYALANQLGTNPNTIEKLRQQKLHERGGFKNRIYLIHAETHDVDH